MENAQCKFKIIVKGHQPVRAGRTGGYDLDTIKPDLRLEFALIRFIPSELKTIYLLLDRSI